MTSFGFDLAQQRLVACNGRASLLSGENLSVCLLRKCLFTTSQSKTNFDLKAGMRCKHESLWRAREGAGERHFAWDFADARCGFASFCNNMSTLQHS